MNSVFLKDFLMISDIKTIVFLAILFVLFYVMKQLDKNKVAFSKRMIFSIIIGLILGFAIQTIAVFPENPMDITFIAETTKWYSLFGNGFMNLLKMLVIPIVMVSIVHVIVNMEENESISKLTRNTLIMAVTMVSIAVIVGLAVGCLFKVGVGSSNQITDATEIKEITSIVDTISGLIPQNIVQSMIDSNIISLVIIAAFFGIGTKRMSKKYMDIVKPFIDLTNALYKIVMSIAMTIIKLMPYAVIALLANTIAQRGMASIIDVGLFILALYVAIIIMFIIQLVMISLFGINPIIYLKKGISVMVLAFTSRSSVGTLPLTIETLSKKMGVNDGTASFVAGFGTTAGMQGCSGVFPALVLVYVYNVNNLTMDISFIAMALVVTVFASFGVAGIPGTATMSASVALSGVGQASLFPTISPIFAVDPIADMGRTFLNVSGAMTNALIIDKTLGKIDMNCYKDMTKI